MTDQMNHQGNRMMSIVAEHQQLGPEYAFVRCTKCRESARIEFSSGVPDDELQRQFEKMGWSIRPTLCPEHAS